MWSDIEDESGGVVEKDREGCERERYERVGVVGRRRGCFGGREGDGEMWRVEPSGEGDGCRGRAIAGCEGV